MSRCWKQRMNERPAFKELAEIFETMMKKSVVSTCRMLLPFEDYDVENVMINLDLSEIKWHRSILHALCYLHPRSIWT